MNKINVTSEIVEKTGRTLSANFLKTRVYMGHKCVSDGKNRSWQSLEKQGRKCVKFALQKAEFEPFFSFCSFPNGNITYFVTQIK